MTFAKLIESLADGGLRVVRRTDDTLACEGEQQNLTQDLKPQLQAHRQEFLRLLPSPADQCRKIVSDAIDAANALCPPAWFGSATAWETYDDAEQRLYDAARAEDVQWCRQAADEFLRTCEALFAVPTLMAWDGDPWDIGKEAIMQ